MRRTPGPDGRVIPVIRLGAGQGPTGWPRVAAYGRYVWVTWAEQRDGQFQIRLAHFHQEKFLKVETVSTGTGDAIRPVIALDASQTPWVAWEERRKRHFTVLVRRMSRFLKSHPWVVDETGELNLRPALVGGPGKSVTIAWDHYENGAYDIRLRRVLERKMEPPVWITRDDYLDQAPALQIDAVGRTWIAWHSNRPSEGAASQAPRAGRSLQIAALEQGSLRPPAAGQPPTLPAMPGRLELDERLEFPTLAQDRAGRLFLFARRGQGFVALHLSGDGWSAPIANVVEVNRKLGRVKRLPVTEIFAGSDDLVPGLHGHAVLAFHCRAKRSKRPVLELGAAALDEVGENAQVASAPSLVQRGAVSREA